MTKEVLVAIKGLQFDAAQEETNIETVSVAQYYEKNNSHYIIYDEIDEDSEENTKNIIKFKEDKMELTKKGLVNVHMIFEKDKKNLTNYATPFGNILIGIDAQKITMDKQEEHIKVNVDYALEVNYEHLADCKITMEIMPKGQANGLFN
ncbi:MAG: DUF1934 domain-containing protein [Lachnospiraceae bacterium]|nr:DUF1934 domain-containing protein [Lachnospiraceae bacterium]